MPSLWPGNISKPVFFSHGQTQEQQSHARFKLDTFWPALSSKTATMATIAGSSPGSLAQESAAVAAMLPRPTVQASSWHTHHQAALARLSLILASAHGGTPHMLSRRHPILHHPPHFHYPQ